MPELVLPRLAAARSAREAARRDGDDAQPAYAAGLAGLRDDQLAGWVEGLLAEARDRRPRPDGHVPATHLWWVDGEEFLGRIHLRHRLTPFLRDVGGHVGYHVVVAHRRQGHATAMLAAALPVAAELGLDCLLITCDVANTASRRVIEANGGLFHDQRRDKFRWWVPTG